MMGYWKNEERTREIVVDGWLRTGDLYRRDERGYYWHEGRRDDVFKVKGLWVSPLDVEDALLTHPNVAEAAVVQGLDDEGLNMPIAYVVLRPPSDPNESCARILIDHCRSHWPDFKCPATVRFVEELPRTATGKIQRFKLREAGTRNPPGAEEE